jgi:hypothetical protein
VTEDRALDELRLLGEELRAMFADERRAIACLDHARLVQLAEHKLLLSTRLGEARAAAPASIAPQLRMLLAAVRAEAQATAMLASAATEAVRALLGIEQTGYDRLARRTATSSLRLLATY